MRIGIVGAGAAGMTCAWLLQEDHDVVLFEAEPRAGGHIHTVDAEVDGRVVPVEIGAQFFFSDGYTGMHALLQRLGVPTIHDLLAVSMTFEGPSRTIVVPPLRVSSLLTLLNPDALGAMYWFVRFIRAGEVAVRDDDWSLSVQGLIDRAKIPTEAAERVIVPLVAASWGVPRELAREMAVVSVVRVMGLRLVNRPHSFRIEKGLASYIAALIADSPRLDLRLGSPARGLAHLPDGIHVQAGGPPQGFDAVILASNWRTSALLCGSSPRLEGMATALRAFEDYEANVAVHRDARLMPPNRGHWETSNFSLSRTERPRTTVWSGKPWGAPVFRTWMRDGEAEPAGTSHVASYHHIAVTTQHPARQAALAREQGAHGVWAIGMYTDGIDNHESALRSAVKVAERISPHSARVRWFAPLVSP